MPPMATPLPKKKNNTVLIVVLILVILVPCIGILVVGALGFSMFKSTLQPMVGCMMTFEAAKSAVNDYAKEKGHLPKAETWQTEVKGYYAKYLANKQDEFGPFPPSPSEGEWGCKNGDKTTGIAFNSDLSGKKLADVKERYATIMLFEIEKASMNAHARYVPKPNEGSPKIMGSEPRGWITVTVDGDVNLGKNKGKFNFD
jgi:hypothetical protein